MLLSEIFKQTKLPEDLTEEHGIDYHQYTFSIDDHEVIAYADIDPNFWSDWYYEFFHDKFDAQNEADKYKFANTIGASFLFEFQVDGQYGITDEGRYIVTRLFNNIIAIIQKFLQTRNIAEIAFTASEPSRAKLYDRMCRTLSASNGLTYTKEKGIYYLRNPKFTK